MCLTMIANPAQVPLAMTQEGVLGNCAPHQPGYLVLVNPSHNLLVRQT
jgi:hypothetical protein